MSYFSFHLLLSILIYYINPYILNAQNIETCNIKNIISTKKNNNLVHEPVYIKYQIENYGKTIQGIAGRPFDCWEVQNSEGKMFRQNFFVNYLEIQPLKKGEIDEGIVNIITFMVHPDSIFSAKAYEDYWPPDNYKIRRRIDDFPSNTLEITVNEPVGDEKEALEMYKTAIHLEDVDTDSAVKQYWKLIEQHPKSVYINPALTNLKLSYVHATELIEIKKGMETAKKILKKFPDIKYKGRVLHSIRKYYKKINDPEGAKEYFKELYHSTKSAKLKKSAKKIIMQIEKGKL
jgi:tetratricopeptide (TPR) repeat protein